MVILQTQMMCYFLFCVVFSGDGATCERAGFSAEDAGQRDGQPCHCWKDGLHTQHPGHSAAVRYMYYTDYVLLISHKLKWCDKPLYIDWLQEQQEYVFLIVNSNIFVLLFHLHSCRCYFNDDIA